MSRALRFLPLLPNLTLTGVIDILVVAFLFYQALMVVRGTRAGHILLGIFMMVLLYAVSVWAGLEALRAVLSFTVPLIGLAIVLGFLFGCVAGTAVYQKATFLEGKLGQRIGNERVTIIDDALRPGALGSHPFDSDGLPCRRTVVIDKGILKSYLCNYYAARKLGLESTGSADGSGVGPGNFYLQPDSGALSPQDIIAGTKKGLLLIRTLGHGLNSVTGDISRGAFGLWIEDGAIAYPVSEVTISGNLGRILESIEAVGTDLEFHGPIVGPTVKVAEMTVSGS